MPSTRRRAQAVPVFVADYVLMGYGTGAIMAVPAHDSRDFEFARAFSLPIVPVVAPSAGWLAAAGLDEAARADADRWTGAYTGPGEVIGSANGEISLDGLPIDAAKAAVTAWLEQVGAGAGTTSWKLRDWLFSRQRYWGEPFPIVFDEHDLPLAVPESELPVVLPEIDDYAPVVRGDDDESVPEPPLGRATAWREVVLDLGDGPRTYRRELNTMPNWAGSCWYYLRYLDPTNETALVDPAVERYWMQGGADGSASSGGVDLYVGGVEHAVLHLLYARFWHKVLYDLGHVSTPEPFQRLYNQGYILAAAYTDERGVYVPADEVVPDGSGGFTHQGRPVTAVAGKMGKSLKNSVSPQDVYRAYGADTLRLYEMAMGPLDADRPWNAATSSVSTACLHSASWRKLVDEQTGDSRSGFPLRPTDLRARLHRTHRRRGRPTYAPPLQNGGGQVNRAEAKRRTKAGRPHRDTPRGWRRRWVLMLAPLAPHVADELGPGLATPRRRVAPVPRGRPALLVDAPSRSRCRSAARCGRGSGAGRRRRGPTEAVALADPKVVAAIGGATVRRVVVVPGRLVNVVIVTRDRGRGPTAGC
jgi:leucyl-tRNA synthetase